MFKRVFIMTLFLFSLPLSASAAPSSLQVKPVYPDNQVPETKGYFDINVTEEEQLVFQLNLQNTEDSPIAVRVDSANAYTNPTGGIFYSPTVESENTKLLEDAIPLADVLKTEKMVTIPAKGSLDLPIRMTVPKTNAQTLLGGIRVTQVEEATEDDEQELGKDEAAFVLETETTYSIAIKLNLPTKSESNFLTGKAGFLAPSAQVFLEVTNDADLIQDDVEWTYSVLDDAGTELFDGIVSTFNMAPRSQIHFPFPWNYEELTDGTYTLVANGHAGEQVIAVKESFEISNDDIDEYAEVIDPMPTTEENSGLPMWVWISIAVAFGVLMFILGNRRKKD